VDFLGFNVRRYRGKLLIKPSKAAVKRARARLSAEMKGLRGHNAQMALICCRSFAVNMLASLLVNMAGCERAPPGWCRAGLGVGGVGGVFTLSR
jgi:hypothetical protein